MTLSADEQIAILEEVARESTNSAARVAAIKQLREINAARREGAEGFRELDAAGPRDPVIKTK